MLNIIADNHGAHLALIARLLKLEYRLIAPAMVWDAVYESGYTYTMGKVLEWAKEYMEVSMWKWYLETQTVYSSHVAGDIDIVVSDRESLDASVVAFLEALHNAGVVLNLHQYLKTSYWNRNAIKYTWELVLDRTPVAIEIEYWNEHTGRNLEFKIDFFSWLLILYFSKEGKRGGTHMPFVNLFREAKYNVAVTIPRVAIVICGHTRDYYKYAVGHKIFIDNPYVDIFIHTWEKKGPRTYTGETGTMFINEAFDYGRLVGTYRPRKIEIDDLESKRWQFSLLDDHNVLFFHNQQQHDDASFYENADLYSLYKASLLVKQYELEKGFTYDGIIKIPFIFDVKHFDFWGICQNLRTIGTTGRIWLPDCGCKQCVREVNWPYKYVEKKHSEHLNDINVYWMYGKRHVMLHACELYLHAFALADDVLDENIANYVNVAKHRKFREFVYLFGNDYVDKKVYEVNDLPMRVQGFYKQNLYRRYMSNYFCVVSDAIRGEFSRFDMGRNAFGL